MRHVFLCLLLPFHNVPISLWAFSCSLPRATYAHSLFDGVGVDLPLSPLCTCHHTVPSLEERLVIGQASLYRHIDRHFVTCVNRSFRRSERRDRCQVLCTLLPKSHCEHRSHVDDTLLVLDSTVVCTVFVEIGSSEEQWGRQDAAEVWADVLTRCAAWALSSNNGSIDVRAT